MESAKLDIRIIQIFFAVKVDTKESFARFQLISVTPEDLEV